MQQLQLHTILEKEDKMLQDVLDWNASKIQAQTNDKESWSEKEDASKCTIEENEVKVVEMHFLRLSEVIGSDDIHNVIKLICT